MATEEEKQPLIPGAGDNNKGNDGDEWCDVDLSKQPIPEEERGQWRFPSDTNPNTTNTFEPGASSTPSSGERIPLATRLPPEQQGASGGTAETSFITGNAPDRQIITLENVARREIETEFPNASLTELQFRYKEAPRSGGSIVEVKYHTSDKWYPLYTKTRGDLEKTINTSLPKRIKEALGESLDDALDKTNTQLQELQKQEETQRQQLQQTETKAEEAQRLRREMEAISNRTKEAADRIQELEDTQGPLNKEAIQKLKDEKKRLADDHKAKRKQLDALAKAAKEAQQLQQDINKTLLSKGETERRLGQLKGQKDAIQPLDELKQKAADLNEHITEDRRIIEDENTSPSEREAAQGRLATQNQELARVNAEIEARERQRPLLERVKEIFKKYGWTLHAVVLAVGLVLGALALAGLNGMKAGTKAVGQGLKTIGQKLGSLLPGLLGSIVSFIFKAAGQVFSFLAEHAWLLILAVVAFFMERLLKRRSR